MASNENGGNNVRYCTTRRRSSVGSLSKKSAVLPGRRSSWTQSFQNIFKQSLFKKRQSSYSLKSKRKRNTCTFQPINGSNDVKLNPLSRQSSLARVWCVRNTSSTSPTEECLFMPEEKNYIHKQRKNRKSGIRNHKFDVLTSYKNVTKFVFQENLIANKHQFTGTSGDSEHLQKIDEKSLSTCRTLTHIECKTNEDFVEDVDNVSMNLFRQRISSFGSSSYSYSEINSCSPGSSSRGLSDRKDSLVTMETDDLDCSYWTLPFIDHETNSLGSSPIFSHELLGRRNSESAAQNPTIPSNSPDLRMGNSIRRMSDGVVLDGSLRRQRFGRQSTPESMPVERRNTFSNSSRSMRSDCLSDRVRLRLMAARRRAKSECIAEEERFDGKLRPKQGKCVNQGNISPGIGESDQESIRNSSGSPDACQFPVSDIESSIESEDQGSRESIPVETDSSSVLPETDSSLHDDSSPQPETDSMRSSDTSNNSEESVEPDSNKDIPTIELNGVTIDCTDADHINNNVEAEYGDIRNDAYDDGMDDKNDELEFNSVENMMFCSGNHGVNQSGGDDVENVFDAINKEAAKSENKEKDMVVMFLVGGELKVLRRSGVSSSHGDNVASHQDLPSMTRKEQSFHHQNGNHGIHNNPYAQSYKDVNKGRPKSAIIVTRSQSFAGMANQQPQVHRKDVPGAVVLGESFRHHRTGATLPQHVKPVPGGRGAVGFSFKKSPKVPKVPRPTRALLMFQSVKRGIREFIEATKDDIDQLQHRETDGTSTAQGRVHETDKQMKSAERYLKRLEFHLAKLDELHEYYMLQQQLREGVRTMHRAYETSPTSQKTTMTNVKYGYKECTQNMCNIEGQLEAMMGTFNCKLKGMAGFARLCPGDVFEVTTRHGTQKWKTKGRIEKSGNQKWDTPEFNFKAVVGDIINIKGVEVRAFKSILLGQKSCETKDLFSANPQLMTVNINVNGSLKLSIVVTWNPLDGVEETSSYIEMPSRPSQGTPRRRPVSVIALNGQYNEIDQFSTPDRRFSNPVSVQQTKDDNFILRTNAQNPHITNNVTAYHGLDSPHVNSRLNEHLPSAYNHQQTGPIQSQTYGHIQAGFHSSPMLLGDSDSYNHRHVTQPPNFNTNINSNQNSAVSSSDSGFSTSGSAFSSSMPPMMTHLHFPSVTPTGNGHSPREEDNSVLNIEDVIHNLSSSLEDYHGQYKELERLEELLKLAQKLIRRQFRNSSRSSSISVSIESALEAFDFLDTEDILEDPQSPTEKHLHIKTTFDDMLCSPESTAKTADSGIESLAQRLSEDTQLGSSMGSSPVPPSTGNEEVDQCLIYHLTYCERLLENLGAFGPLKCREIYALDKLEKQSTIIEDLLKLAKSASQVDLHSVMSSICEDKSLREFWTKCTDQNTLYINPERLLSLLEQKYANTIADKHMIDPNTVCQHVITRILDIPDYESEKGHSTFVMTLHQFMAYFTDEGGLQHVENVASEMKLVERLTSGNPDVVIKAILTLRDTLPSAPCLKVIGMLLVTMDREVEQCTISYLNLIQKKKENRDKAMVVFVEGLEDRTPELRCGACAALAILEASESIDQLVYLWQSDSSQHVQRKAKDTLLSLGDEGRKAFEDAQLSKHGFQGLQVHK